MQRFWEILLGLDRGFLGRQGELNVQFNPSWPWQQYVGAVTWNLLLTVLAVVLVIYVYRREGRSRPVRVGLGVLRMALLAFLIALLNRPVLTLSQSRVEPSVLAILVDDSVSMRVRDAIASAPGSSATTQPAARLDQAKRLLSNDNAQLLRDLSRTHVLKLYSFNSGAQAIATIARHDEKDDANDAPDPATEVVAAIERLSPDGQNTQVLGSLRDVLEDLQGQRLAGVVLLTDGRETPARPLSEAMAALKDFDVKVYPVPLGSDRAPTNLDVQAVNVQDTAFKGDIVNVKVTVRATGYPAGHPIVLVLKDKKTGRSLPAPDGSLGETRAAVSDNGLVEAELQIKPEEVGTLDLQIEAVEQEGELDAEDNVRVAQVQVLDARIAVLYVDGYPRWDYRYLKNEMMRDKTVDISCLLTSADPAFAQEGDRPIRRFPESIEELLEYDVIVFGDVDPRQFTDAQLQLVSEFVAKKGGGFGMVAGPRWSPAAYRNTAIEPILPVNVAMVQEEDGRGATLTQGFRPVLTTVGAASSIFRFFTDRAANEKYLKDDLQPLFWYSRGQTTKAGVGEAYAEHPTDVGPDGRKTPVLVLGRFGAGRTLFSAVDDSWRWRFYTGESIFDTYWVQQLRYLARSKKLGQRRLTLTSLRPGYELGEQVRVNLRILDPQLLQQLPDQLRVDIQDEATGQTLRQETLQRQEGQNELYTLSYTADRVGRFVLKLPPIAGGIDAMDLPIEVATPRLELSQPQVDRQLLTRLASETLGQTVEPGEVRQTLPALIASAARIIPLEASQPLWDAPLALAIFAVLITMEWILRKTFGML
ncbi:MAG: hypothetical protein ACREIT_03610 [Tepidisphaeraceae bacterium]